MKQFCLLCCLFIFSIKAFALNPVYDIYYRDNNWIGFIVKLDDLNDKEILANIEEGQKSEITLQFRLYHNTRNIFFGNKLIFTKQYIVSGYKDFFQDRYTIERNNNIESYFNNRYEFFTDFLKVGDDLFFELQKADIENYYITARVVFFPEKLEPPLHIIDIFKSMNFSTNWKKIMIRKK